LRAIRDNRWRYDLVGFLPVDIRCAGDQEQSWHIKHHFNIFLHCCDPEKVWEGFVSQESNRIIFAALSFKRT